MKTRRNPLDARSDSTIIADSTGSIPGSVQPVLLPTLTVLAHPDPRRVGHVATLQALAEGRVEEVSRTGPVFSRPGWGAALPLEDRHLSRSPLRLVPGAGGELSVVASQTTMHVEVDGRRVTDEPLRLDGARWAAGVVVLLARRITLLLHVSDPAPVGRLPRFGLVGDSDAVVGLRREIQRAALVDVPVILRGETGTGKELVARALHEAGPRRGRAFVPVNMGALAPNLATAELFGAARGAYTGADRARRGFFEQADGGTLFLDEIGETAPEVGAALLRVLETGQIQSVGDPRGRQVDVRLVTATDRDLEAAVESGEWSRALLFRLAGWEIRLPPLRDRREDLGRLLAHFLKSELERLRGGTLEDGDPALALPGELVASLALHPWPGNLRELRNVARELAVTAFAGGPPGAQVRRLEGLWQRVAAAAPAPSESVTPQAKRRPSEISADELEAALEAHGFQVKAAAAALGISRTSLYKLMDAAGMPRAESLDDAEIRRARARHGDDLEMTARELRVSVAALRRRLGSGDG